MRSNTPISNLMQSLIYSRLGNKLLKKFISRGYARWFRPSAFDQSVLVGAAGRKAYTQGLFGVFRSGWDQVEVRSGCREGSG